MSEQWSVDDVRSVGVQKWLETMGLNLLNEKLLELYSQQSDISDFLDYKSSVFLLIEWTMLVGQESLDTY